MATTRGHSYPTQVAPTASSLRLRKNGRRFVTTVALLSTAALSCSEASVEPDTAVCDPAQCPISRSAVAPLFQVGTDADRVPGGEPFVPATDGTELKAILGGQGAWMIELAVATNRFDCCVKRVNIRVSLTSSDCGRTLGALNLRRRPLSWEYAGIRYVPNVQLVLGADRAWEDEKAVLTLSLEPYGGGETFEQSLTVALARKRDGDSAPPIRFGTSAHGEASPDGFCSFTFPAELTLSHLEAEQVGVVFAARTQSLSTDVTEVYIDASLETAAQVDPKCEPTDTEQCLMVDVERGRIAVRRHPVVRREDGTAYVFGIPLPVASHRLQFPAAATVTLSLKPVGGGPPVHGTAFATLLAPAP